MEIEEAYVSFEVAKLLKEKGFEQYKCQHSYDSKGVFQWSDDLDPYECSAPTHQMACDWVRKKGWHISVQLSYDDDYNAVYYVTITSIKTFLGEDIGELEDKYFSKVEDANDEALKFVLINLISYE